MTIKTPRGRNVTECGVRYTCDGAQLETMTALAREAGISRNEFMRRAIDAAISERRAPAGRDRRLKAVMDVWGDLDDDQRKAIAVLATDAARGGRARQALERKTMATPTLEKAQVLIEHYEVAAQDSMTEEQRKASGMRAAEIEYRRGRLADDMMQGRATAATAHELWDQDPDKGKGYANWINESLAWCSARFGV